MLVARDTVARLLAAVSTVFASTWSHANETPSRTGVEVPMAGLTIYPGDEISESMLVTKTIDRAHVPLGMVEAASAAVGKVARRTLVRGQFIPASALRQKQDVVQGRQYKLVFRDAHLAIAASGIALQSAAVGDTINVRNADTGVVVRARIAADRVLVVEAP